MPDKHAYLSASASDRWIHCPPSAKLCAAMDDQSSPYAKEGTDAHSLCEYLLKKALGIRTRDPTENLSYYNEEMQECAEGYRDFVLEQLEEAKKHCPDPKVYVEQHLDFSHWVRNGFGTGDCVIVADDLLQIIDYKHGLGIPVSAAGPDGTGNSQLLCYGLGAIATFGWLYDIKTVKLSIYQPRRENVNSFSISKEDLLKWADNVLKPAAEEAYAGSGAFHAGSHCQFCKIKATCRERAMENLKMAQYEFKEPPELTNEEVADILPQADHLISWINDIKDYALQQALSGVHFDHFKLVEGKSNRKYTDEQAVAAAVIAAGYDPYEKKLLGITAMTKELGKKNFETILGGLVIKPQGKPALVPDTDKRPELSTAKEDFKGENDYE